MSWISIKNAFGKTSKHVTSCADLAIVRLVELEPVLHSTPEVHFDESRWLQRVSWNHALHTEARHCEVDVV